MEVVDKIAKVAKNRNDRPLTPVVIEKAELIGETAEEPEKI